MEQDEHSPRKKYPLSPAKMSKTPSWIMLGFALGALFVIALPPLRNKPATSPLPVERLEAARPPPRPPQPLTIIEDVFTVWSAYAVWFDDTTEVALWNSDYKDFTDCYEVRKFGNIYYFRSIPKLTRRILTHGKLPPESPLQFTESEEQYREWLEHGRTERPVSHDLRPPRPTAPTVSAPASADRVRVSPPPRVMPLPPVEKPSLTVPSTGKQ